MKVLVTGSAGFVGYHMVERLLKRGDEVVGLDSLNDYYEVEMKYNRLITHGIDPNNISYNTVVAGSLPNYTFTQLKIEDKPALEALFAAQKFDKVIHLAAQAGVRYSLNNPQAYIDSNFVGFSNVLECCRFNQIQHLVYASSSSVYGLNECVPFTTSQNVDHPISLYAASKKSNELMAHVYSHLFRIPTTGLRFFTVYGPWGRPDMALFLFTKAIIEDKPINVFNNGNMIRDFTYVDDIVEGVMRVVDHPPGSNPQWNALNPAPDTSSAPYKIYNIGNNAPCNLMEFIHAIENELNKKAIMNFMPIQPGDVAATFADVSDLVADFDYKPGTSIQSGVKAFVDWYRDYYKV